MLDRVLGTEKAARLDLFDRIQLSEVLRICHRARGMSDAGRILFAVSRNDRTVTKDADPLRKYLGRFGLQWSRIVGKV